MNSQSIHHPGESGSNAFRDVIDEREPRALRTFTPTKAVIARSSGVFHWTPEGRRLYDFSSGVLVANLGHNPRDWFDRFTDYMGWSSWRKGEAETWRDGNAYFQAQPWTAYNAITGVEAKASQRLVERLQKCHGGKRLEQVLWAASGSEAVQKALWASLARDPKRDIIIATRYGFHGKKGLAEAVTGCETDHNRDPRVRFISFPMEECRDVSQRAKPFSPLPYQRELDALQKEFGGRLAALITEPYLGGAGSYHPPKDYLQLLQSFCRANDITFILDEIQSNFGRTASLFAYEAYALEPDVVVLGKGLANGAPGACAVGPASLFGSLDYGEGSDTYSANPLVCAAVLATLDSYENSGVLANARRASPIIEEGLVRLKEFPFVKYVRGEKDGMVWGVEMADYSGKTAAEMANACVLACYLGEPGVSAPGGDGIHLLGPLARKVLRIAPPLVITDDQARSAMDLIHRLLRQLV